MELGGVNFGYHVCNEVSLLATPVLLTFVVSYICIPFYRGSALLLDCEDDEHRQQVSATGS